MVKAAIVAQRKLDADGRVVRVANDANEDGIEDEDWQDRLLRVLKTISPDAFERLAKRLLRESGFTKVEVTGRSGDQGIDGTGILQLNLISFPVLFQCKRYEGSVGPGAIRDFRGAMMGRSDKGLFITTGSFTAEAKKEATRDGAPSIELIDGPLLCDLLKKLGLGVAVRMVEVVEPDDEWFKQL
jgi:restriction system protein